MKPRLYEIWPGLYQLEANKTGLDWTYIEDHIQLEKNLQKQGQDRWWVYHIEPVEDTKLQHALDWVNSMPVWQEIFEAISRDEMLERIWQQLSFPALQQHCHFNSQYVKTPPRFRDHPWHTDGRRYVIQGMIFLEPGEENQGTDFHCLETGAQHTFVPSPGKGWLLINNHFMKHRGNNDTDMYRHTIKFSCNLPI